MTVTEPGLPLFREGGDRQKDSTPPETDVEKGEESKDERLIRCAHCGQDITSIRYRLKVNGASQHTFFNPAGIVFQIRCFSRTFGCLASGPSSLDFSWFKGFSWRFLLCSACFSHLGWLFESATTSFSGLICNKVLGSE